MSNGMIWLAGFVMGGVTAFVVLAVPMRTRYWELRVKYERERARRIEAEDNGRHTNDALRAISSHDWGGPLSDLGVGSSGANRPQSEAETVTMRIDSDGEVVEPTIFIDEDDWREYE